MCTKGRSSFKKLENLPAIIIGILLGILLRYLLDILVLEFSTRTWLYFITGMLLIFCLTTVGFGILSIYWKFKKKEKTPTKYFRIINWVLCICAALLFL
jgi:hypothetical protein